MVSSIANSNNFKWLQELQSNTNRFISCKSFVYMQQLNGFKYC